MTAIDQTATATPDPDEHPSHGGLQPSCRWIGCEIAELDPADAR